MPACSLTAVLTSPVVGVFGWVSKDAPGCPTWHENAKYGK